MPLLQFGPVKRGGQDDAQFAEKLEKRLKREKRKIETSTKDLVIWSRGYSLVETNGGFTVACKYKQYPQA